MENNAIIMDLESSTGRLAEAFMGFPVNEFNRSISTDTWSAGDIAEHLYIVESFIGKMITGATRPSNRDPLQKATLVGTTFNDFEKKFTAAREISPTQNPKDRDEISSKLINNRTLLVNLLKTHDLTVSCLDFIHPKFGELTRAEWIYFIIYHGDRHLHQLENVRKFIAL
ncbi:MAG: DinB family protein [Ignavibacteria bacterium]|jgi:hypothetical protein|nr:DinB family protein [Ignavibacteria bacterium]MCU7504650.1 DinB family protein [Ignavibacteria bacterium]MCU7517542.1 DinB family protein [Ignavibacteria bacterium]